MKINMNIEAPQTTSRGPKCFSGGSVTPRTRSGSHHQEFAMLAKVAGQENDDLADLRQLDRLEADRADSHTQVRTVHLLPQQR